jgi:hypothetical protein
MAPLGACLRLGMASDHKSCGTAGATELVSWLTRLKQLLREKRAEDWKKDHILARQTPRLLPSKSGEKGQWCVYESLPCPILGTLLGHPLCLGGAAALESRRSRLSRYFRCPCVEACVPQKGGPESLDEDPLVIVGCACATPTRLRLLLCLSGGLGARRPSARGCMAFTCVVVLQQARVWCEQNLLRALSPRPASRTPGDTPPTPVSYLARGEPQHKQVDSG